MGKLWGLFITGLYVDKHRDNTEIGIRRWCKKVTAIQHVEPQSSTEPLGGKSYAEFQALNPAL